jgi:hypothetical protein
MHGPTGLWIICRDQRLADLNPRMRAKWYKMHPHLLFPRGRPGWRENRRLRLVHPLRRYDYTIWIDGSIAPKSEHFARDLVGAVGASGIAVFKHPDRDCIYDEAKESVRWAKYNGLPIMQQVESYRAEGYPEHHGLMAAGVIVRRTGLASLARMDEAWWQENLRWTCQDQLSLPVVQWRLGLTNEWIPRHLWFNPWYDYIPHRLEEGPLKAVEPT